MIETDFFYMVKFFVWDDPYLFKYCSDQVFSRFIPDHEFRSVILFFHDQSCGGISAVRKQQLKFLNVVFIGLLYLEMLLNIVRITLDANNWVGSVDEI